MKKQSKTNEKEIFNANNLSVRETDMSDGKDRIWYWQTKQAAFRSGRFDYLIENGNERECLIYKKMKKSKTIEEFIDLVGYPFSLA